MMTDHACIGVTNKTIHLLTSSTGVGVGEEIEEG